MAATLASQLSTVQTAIAEIEAGAQEVQCGDRRMKRADLALLYAREKRLLAQVDRSGADWRRVAEF